MLLKERAEQRREQGKYIQGGPEHVIIQTTQKMMEIHYKNPESYLEQLQYQNGGTRLWLNTITQ